MSTRVQGLIAMQLIKQGWKSIVHRIDEDLSDVPIGGPILMEDPSGTKYFLMPDGTLKDFDEKQEY